MGAAMWFTQATLLQVIEEAGLDENQVCDIASVNADNQGVDGEWR